MRFQIEEMVLRGFEISVRSVQLFFFFLKRDTKQKENLFLICLERNIFKSENIHFLSDRGNGLAWV